MMVRTIDDHDRINELEKEVDELKKSREEYLEAEKVILNLLEASNNHAEKLSRGLTSKIRIVHYKGASDKDEIEKAKDIFLAGMRPKLKVRKVDARFSIEDNRYANYYEVHFNIGDYNDRD